MFGLQLGELFVSFIVIWYQKRKVEIMDTYSTGSFETQAWLQILGNINGIAVIIALKMLSLSVNTGEKSSITLIVIAFVARITLLLVCFIQFMVVDGREPILKIWVIIGGTNSFFTVLYQIWEFLAVHRFMKQHDLYNRLNKNV